MGEGEGRTYFDSLRGEHYIEEGERRDMHSSRAKPLVELFVGRERESEGARERERETEWVAAWFLRHWDRYPGRPNSKQPVGQNKVPWWGQAYVGVGIPLHIPPMLLFSPII